MGPAEYEVLLQLIHTATGKLCGSTATGFTCDGSNYTFRVPFKDPVEIQPNTSYIAAATLKVKVEVDEAFNRTELFWLCRLQSLRFQALRASD